MLPLWHINSAWGGGALSTASAGAPTSTERVFYISSLPADTERIARGVRSHWKVENRLHWCLDMQFNEDQSHVRIDSGRQQPGHHPPHRHEPAATRYDAQGEHQIQAHAGDHCRCVLSPVAWGMALRFYYPEILRRAINQ